MSSETDFNDFFRKTLVRAIEDDSHENLLDKADEPYPDLISHQLPLMMDRMAEQNRRLSNALSSLIRADAPDPSFIASPTAYLTDRDVYLFGPGEIAPGYIINDEGLRGMVASARDYVANGGEIPPYLAVGAHTSTETYVAKNENRSFTYDTGRSHGTRKGGITESSTSTSAATSRTTVAVVAGRDIFSVDLTHILIDPGTLSEEGQS